MVNMDRLKKEIVRKGFTEDELAGQLELDALGFRNKMEGIASCFTINEAYLLVELLKLDGEEATKIFFHKSRI